MKLILRTLLCQNYSLNIILYTFVKTNRESLYSVYVGTRSYMSLKVEVEGKLWRVMFYDTHMWDLLRFLT